MSATWRSHYAVKEQVPNFETMSI